MYRLALLLGCAGLGAQPRGYSIPFIDLAAETERQVVVDRDPSTYLGHPTTALLADGRTLLAVYPKGHGRGPIVLKRSRDGGRTWSERLPAPANWATSQETPTLHRVLAAGGKPRLLLFSGLYPIRMSRSEDDGVNWTPLEPIGSFGGVVAMSSLVRLRDGRQRAFFYDDGRFLHGENKSGPFVVYTTVSRDGGLTWSEPRAIVAHSEAQLCEPGVVRSPSGGRLAMLLRENSRRFNSFMSFSDDEGENWTAPFALPGALTGDRHAAVYAPDGRLLVTFRDTTLESPTRGDWVAWVGRFEDLLAQREGQYRVRLMKNHKEADCCYAGIERLRDGTLVATSYGHWAPNEQPFIVSVRLTLAELDARAPRR
jgi:hypothetical protein